MDQRRGGFVHLPRDIKRPKQWPQQRSTRERGIKSRRERAVSRSACTIRNTRISMPLQCRSQHKSVPTPVTKIKRLPLPRSFSVPTVATHYTAPDSSAFLSSQRPRELYTHDSVPPKYHRPQSIANRSRPQSPLRGSMPGQHRGAHRRDASTLPAAFLLRRKIASITKP